MFCKHFLRCAQPVTSYKQRLCFTKLNIQSHIESDSPAFFQGEYQEKPFGVRQSNCRFHRVRR